MSGGENLSVETTDTQFSVGDLVTCRMRPDGAVKRWAKEYPEAKFPENGHTYTVRAVNDWGHYTLLRFEELDNSSVKLGSCEGEIEPGFNSRFFARASGKEA